MCFIGKWKINYPARKLKYFQILEEAKYDEEKKEWYCNNCN